MVVLSIEVRKRDLTPWFYIVHSQASLSATLLPNLEISRAPFPGIKPPLGVGENKDESIARTALVGVLEPLKKQWVSLILSRPRRV